MDTQHWAILSHINWCFIHSTFQRMWSMLFLPVGSHCGFWKWILHNRLRCAKWEEYALYACIPCYAAAVLGFLSVSCCSTSLSLQSFLEVFTRRDREERWDSFQDGSRTLRMSPEWQQNNLLRYFMLPNELRTLAKLQKERRPRCQWGVKCMRTGMGT